MRKVIALALLASACSAKGTLPAVRDGDVIFHTSRSSQSVAIQRATGSKYSHMGLIVHRKGRPFVFEAISTVQFTPLDRWIQRGTGSHFVVKRLRNADTLLTPKALEKLRSAAGRFAGRPYDLTFGWSDDRIYCSELVWKAYDRALGLQLGRQLLPSRNVLVTEQEDERNQQRQRSVELVQLSRSSLVGLEFHLIQ